MPGQAFQHGEVVAIAPVPALDGAAGQAQGRKRHDPCRVEKFHVAQAVAAGAGAHRRVEGKQPRLHLAQAIAADRAGELGTEQVLFARVHFQRNRLAIGQPQRGLEAFGQPLLQIGAHLDAVNHHIDVVLLGFFQLGQVIKFIGRAVDAKAHIALGLHLGKHIDKLALALARHRRQDHQLGVFGQGQHGIDHFADALRLQRQIMLGAVGRAGARKQQAQVVVNFGDRAHGGTRVVRGGLLLDGNRGRQALDHVDVGLVHQLQKLPGVGGQAFHITALPLGIERVKGQRGLAGTAQAGDHHQLVARNIEVDILEVVRARPADADALGGQHAGKVLAVVGRVHWNGAPQNSPS